MIESMQECFNKLRSDYAAAASDVSTGAEFSSDSS